MLTNYAVTDQIRHSLRMWNCSNLVEQLFAICWENSRVLWTYILNKMVTEEQICLHLYKHTPEKHIDLKTPNHSANIRQEINRAKKSCRWWRTLCMADTQYNAHSARRTVSNLTAWVKWGGLIQEHFLSWDLVACTNIVATVTDNRKCFHYVPMKKLLTQALCSNTPMV